MKRIVLLALGSAALVLLVVALSPQSSWAFRNVIGFWRGEGVLPADFTQASPSLILKMPEDTDNPMAELEKLNGAAEPARSLFVVDFLKRFGDDTQAVGALGRRTTNAVVQDGMKIPDPNRKSRAESIILVGRQLERIDPKNSFGPMMIAMGEYTLGHRLPALIAMRRAAKCETYSTYPLEEADGRIKVLEQAYGYRGHRLRIGVFAGILFPELASIKMFGRLIAREGSLQDRVDMAHVGLTMVRSKDAFITNLVGIAVVRSLFTSDPKAPTGSPEARRALSIKHFENFRREVDAKGIKVEPDFWRKIETIAVVQVDTSNIVQFDFPGNLDTILGQVSLPLLIAGAVLCLFSLLKTRKQPNELSKLQNIFGYLVIPVVTVAFVFIDVRAVVVGDCHGINWLDIFAFLGVVLGAWLMRRSMSAILGLTGLVMGTVVLLVGVAGEVKSDAILDKQMQSLLSEADRTRQLNHLDDI